MHRNTCLVYHGVTEVYDKLMLFYSGKGFKIIERDDKFYLLKAKKRSIFFWRTIHLELNILAVEKEQVEVAAKVVRMGKRQLKLESEFITAMENFLNARSA